MKPESKNTNDKLLYWDNLAKNTRWGKYITEIEEQAILKAHNLAEKPTTALEIGCEGGRWAEFLTKLNWDVICSDVTQHKLDVCQLRVPTAKYVLVSQDDTKLPCETESLGMLLCIEVYNVIKSDWFIDEAARVLNKKGLLVVALWNRLSLRGLYLSLTSPKDSVYTLSYSVWKKNLSQKGFKILYEEGLCWFPFKRDSNSPLILMFSRM